MTFNFKNEEDVQAYLKNIYMEYRFGCETEKNGNACHLYGDYMESIKQDIEQAASIYKSNCDERNWPRSCAKFGGYKILGKGCEKNIPEAFKYLQKGCELNDAKGCVQGGALASIKTITIEEDKVSQLKKAMEMFRKACFEFKEEPGCFYLSGIYMGSHNESIEPNFTEAYKLSLISCEMGNPFACANVAQMHARGDGVQKNQEIAEVFKERATILHKELSELQRQLQFQQGINT
ncbi:cytochrome c oxidase assembly factor 7 homolog [Diachasma alloeum]|uniref:cytochrome c oxidase assembly factor 7 homolog n=1 Tax=Diachasma alloeum TaxID=454923 RepID=UPI0007383B7B|nr:cytochrome c oxidase assembly factor 7 homolog [Diachasma alloeum]